MAEKRSIFEEVSETQKPAATPGGVTGGRGRAKAWGRRAMRLWLMALFVLVVIMIAVGGLTRLTDSGLSITEWRAPVGRDPAAVGGGLGGGVRGLSRDPRIPVAEPWHEP
jgi:cytochrome c oxidase assembly protein subunit 15